MYHGTYGTGWTYRTKSGEETGGTSYGIPVYHGTYGMGWICRTLGEGSGGTSRDLMVHPIGSQYTRGGKNGSYGTSHWIPVYSRWQEWILWYIPLDPSIPEVARRDLMVHPIGSQYTRGGKNGSYGTSHWIQVHPRL